jgi:hypothetical protein
MKKGSRGTEGVRRSSRKSVHRGRPSAYSTPEEHSETSSGSEGGTAAAFIPEGVISSKGIPDPPIFDPEEEVGVGGSLSETEDHMAPSRLRYGRFKGDGSQDVDDWLSEFIATANANQETEESQLRMFQGVLKGEALKWFQEVPDGVRASWNQLAGLFLRTFREAGGEARALGRLSKMSMKPNESVRKYGQRVRSLIQKLTTDIAPAIQVEWYVSGFPEDMGFQIRQSRPSTLRDAMEAAQNYENSAQSLRKALRRSKNRKSKNRKSGRDARRKHRHSGTEDSSTHSSSSIRSSETEESEDSSLSPRKASRSSKHRRDGDRMKGRVKEEAPGNSETRKIMKDIHEALEAIKVNITESRKPRKAIPMVRSNVWCAKCGESGHYPSECQRRSGRPVQFVDAEGTVYFARPEEEEDELEDSSVFQVAPSPGRGKAPQQLFRVTNSSYHPQNSGSGSGFSNHPLPSGFPERQYGLCFVCGSPQHFANSCPSRGLGGGAPIPLPCQNCQGYGHGKMQCPYPAQQRPSFKPVDNPPRDQTALNYGHKDGIENPET